MDGHEPHEFTNERWLILDLCLSVSNIYVPDLDVYIGRALKPKKRRRIAPGYLLKDP